MSTTYSVVLSLSTTGSLDAKLGAVGSAAAKVEQGIARVGSSASTMGSAIEGFGNRMGGALDSVLTKVTDIGLGIAKWGGAAVLAGAVYGVGKLNADLETSKISLAAIFQAGNLTTNFTGGMAMAGDQIAKMKQDVQTLPGTFMQLAQLMQTTATTGIAGGMDADKLRKFAGRTMLTASIVAPTIDSNLLQKEIVNLMAGKAGTHNILGLRLGLEGEKAKDFNALAPEKRIAALNALYDKYADATLAIAGSWKAVWTTVKDSGLYKALGPGTEMLFNRVKEDLVKVNKWVEKNQGKVEQFSRLVGSHLANAWDRAVNFAERHEAVLTRIVDLVSHIGLPNMAAMGEKVIPAVIGLKLLPSALSGGGHLLGGLMSSFGGLATGAEEAGAATLGAAGGILALGAAAVAAAAVLGTLDNMSQKNGDFHRAADEDVHKIVEDVKLGSKLVKTVAEDVRPALDGLGSSITHFLRGILDRNVKALNEDYSGPINAARPEGGSIGDIVRNVSNQIARNSYGYNPYGRQETIERGTDDLTGGSIYLRKIAEEVTAPKPEQRDFGTTIQKVEIVVKGSDDPSRVAKSVLRHFQEWQNHRTSNHPLLKGLGT